MPAKVTPFVDLLSSPEFIKVGEFSKRHLIWWTKRTGYMVTDPQGFDFTGQKRIKMDDLEKARK